jgi:hypothetical protein
LLLTEAVNVQKKARGGHSSVKEVEVWRSRLTGVFGGVVGRMGCRVGALEHASPFTHTQIKPVFSDY